MERRKTITIADLRALPENAEVTYYIEHTKPVVTLSSTITRYRAECSGEGLTIKSRCDYMANSITIIKVRK